MKNTYKIIWSDEALKNLITILEYLENRWTQKEIKKFSQLLDQRINLIASNPYLFAETETSKGLRKCILSKQTTIYYRIFKTDIHFVTLFDNRRKPFL